MNYYNEFDPHAAQWIKNLIAAGEIPNGEVDTRSITEVRAKDLKGFTQHHFFAGLAGWPLALRLAGWPEDRPIISGSPRVKVSRPQEKRKDKKTSAISGPICSGSSASQALTWLLASRLRQRLSSVGSMEFSQTWKESATPAGRQFLAHTASGRRTSDNESSLSQSAETQNPLTGWRSPMSGDGEGGVMEIRPGTAGKYKLRDEAALAGWPTPNTMTGGQTSRRGDRKDEPLISGLAPWPTPRTPTGGAESGARKQELGRTESGGGDLQAAAQTAGWATPAATSWGGSVEAHLERKRKAIAAGKKMGLVVSCLDQQATLASATGVDTTSSRVPTASRGVLNPAFSLCLMLYPEVWQRSCPEYEAWRSWQDFLKEI